MSRRARIGLAAGALVAAAVAAAAAPKALRRMEFFRVRGVEVFGLRYLDARRVAAALALPKVTVPGPLVLLQVTVSGLGRLFASTAAPSRLATAGRTISWSGPALT